MTGSSASYISITIKNSYISPIHFRVFINNYHSPATIITGTSSITFGKCNICYKIFTQASTSHFRGYLFIGSKHSAVTRISYIASICNQSLIGLSRTFKLNGSLLKFSNIASTSTSPIKSCIYDIGTIRISSIFS